DVEVYLQHDLAAFVVHGRVNVGNSFRAPRIDLMKNGRKVSLRPFRSAASFRWSRRWTSWDMSTSSTYVKWAAVTLDFAIFSKIRLRRPWMGIRSSPPTVGRIGVAAGAAREIAAFGAIAGVCAPFRTSSSVIRPCGPVPRSAPRFTFSSFARRRTAGAARASPEEGGGGGALDFAGAEGIVVVRGAADGFVGAPSPASPNTMRVAPTFTTSPSLARSWSTLPVTGEGIWTVTLSVITSTTGSFSRIGSPSLTNHLTTSPSWTPSPISGSLNSRAIVAAGERSCHF